LRRLALHHAKLGAGKGGDAEPRQEQDHDADEQQRHIRRRERLRPRADRLRDTQRRCCQRRPDCQQPQPASRASPAHDSAGGNV